MSQPGVRTVRLFVAVLGLAAALGCGTVAKEIVLNHPKVRGFLDEPVLDRTVTHTGRVETIGEGDDTITVLYVSGSPYEMGYQQGQLLGPQVRQTIDGVMDGLYRFLPKELRQTRLLTTADRTRIVNAVLDRAWANMAPYVPREDLEELQGLADGSGIALAVLQRMHAIPDVTETSCSALLARGSATATGHAYQLRILDYGAEFRLYERPLITVYRPATGQAYLNISWVGFIGVVSGMNQQGVGISEIGHGDPPGEHLHGVPMPFLLKNVLRHAHTADEAAAIVRAAPRTNSYIYFFGDRQGGGVAMVTSAEEVVVHRPNEQPFIEERGKRYPQFTDVLYAGHYQAKQAELVAALAGKIDVAAVQDLARQISMKSNLQTVIYDLTEQTLWIANRTAKERASDRAYVEFPAAQAWTR